MYKDFYGLKNYPFNITPDPRFIVFTPSYNELLARIYYGIEMAKGLIVLTGEVGTGKTTALRWILRRFDSSVLAAYIFNPNLSIDEFYYQLSQMFGIVGWSNKASLLVQLGKLLEKRHRSGLRTVLIVDEAHELSNELLEEVRLLLNFESDNAKYLQIILAGQPELREKFKHPGLRQLRQRVVLNCQIPVLVTIEEIERYILERLVIAGYDQQNMFTPDAIDFIFQCSEGIPRQINNLCDNAMLTAFERNVPQIDRDLIEEVARDLFLLPDKEALMANDKAAESVNSARILTRDGYNTLIEENTLTKTLINEEIQSEMYPSNGYKE